MSNALKFKPLEAFLVERGKVTSAVLFQHGLFSVSILKLSPGAKIRRHSHPADNEKYVIEETGEVSVCIKGFEHELENPYDKEITVISIKWI